MPSASTRPKAAASDDDPAPTGAAGAWMVAPRAAGEGTGAAGAGGATGAVSSWRAAGADSRASTGSAGVEGGHGLGRLKGGHGPGLSDRRLLGGRLSSDGVLGSRSLGVELLGAGRVCSVMSAHPAGNDS